MTATGSLIRPGTGEAILDLARAHVGQKYLLGVLAPKDNASWRGPWDCSEFASWVVFQTVATLYGCERDHGDPSTADAFTGYWERDAKALGRIISIEQAARTPGAFVLRIPQVRTSGHVVFRWQSSCQSHLRRAQTPTQPYSFVIVSSRLSRARETTV